MDFTEEINEVRRLASEKGAVILAHNYCRAEVQDAADFTGDSLELSRKAMEVDSPIIVFCGVSFMAETAKILNPARMVLVPDPSAGCPMADSVTAADVRAMKEKFPSAKAVCYVNSTAAVKAECYICVTSGNAEKVMATLKGEEIIFVPDRHLGGHVSALLGEHYRCWQGCCPVHDALSLADVAAGRREAGIAAPVLVHPECDKAVREAADRCLSTGGMCRFVRESAADAFVIGTEEGILHRLKKENPEKKFYPIGGLVCADMKKITLAKVKDSLLTLKSEVTVDDEIASKARAAIERMLSVS